MTPTAELLALGQARTLCRNHQLGLMDALDDLDQRHLTGADLVRLGKEDRRLLDQFAYRYTRLQDDMGAKLLPGALRAMGEEISAMSVLDRLDRLEQLDWLPSADEWAELRRIRNEFTHEYPETAAERLERLQLAIASAKRLLEILEGFNRRIGDHFGVLGR